MSSALKISVVSPLVVMMWGYQVLLMLIAVLTTEYKSSFADEMFTLLMFPFALVYCTQKYAINMCLWFLAYAAIGGVSIFVSNIGGVPQPIAGLYDVILDMKLPVIFLGMLYFLSYDKKPERTLRQICVMFVVIALVNLPFVLKDFFANSGVGLYGQSLTPRAGLFQPQGLLHHHTDSVWRAYVATLCAFYLLSLRYSMPKLLLCFVFCVYTFLYLSTKEMISIVVFVFLFFYGKNLKSQNLLLILPIGIATALVFYNFTPLGLIVQSQFDAYLSADSYQDQARTVLTIQSYHVANDFFPFGSGAGTYASMPSYVLGYSDVYYMYGLNLVWGANLDNPLFLTDVFWPKVLAQTGWFGLIVYLIFFWKIFGVAFSGVINNKDKISWLCAAVCISVFVFSLAATPYSQEFMMVVVVFFAAYAINRIRIKGGQL